MVMKMRKLLIVSTTLVMGNNVLQRNQYDDHPSFRS
jgi:hypothetical protein